MSWALVLPVLSAVLVVTITAVSGYLVARNGRAEKREERESGDVRNLIDQLQEQADRAELAAERANARIEELERRVDEQRATIRGHEDNMARLERENAALRARLVGLEHGGGGC